ncbi:MAG: class I SAM-dependent methyltransferase, partial [Candidatus Hydrothermarchaeota archaeon]
VLAGGIKKHGVKNVLEIGALFGYSAILMARLLPEDGMVVTLEMDEGVARIARRNIEEAGLSERVEIVVGDALETIPGLKGIFDLLFIDGTKEEYLEYLRLAEKKLGNGAVIVADNVGIFEEQMRDYLKYVRSSGRYMSETVKVPLEFTEDVEDAMEISVRLRDG